ncbi:MAG: BspA family leucine-rich repeat surface protein [Erysipelotrichaceae bacterium]|nr:BspA family leucine-rich repeat surface protein [Erysipelotrichaceae bacterium]
MKKLLIIFFTLALLLTGSFLPAVHADEDPAATEVPTEMSEPAAVEETEEPTEILIEEKTEDETPAETAGEAGTEEAPAAEETPVPEESSSEEAADVPEEAPTSETAPTPEVTEESAAETPAPEETEAAAIETEEITEETVEETEENVAELTAAPLAAAPVMLTAANADTAYAVLTDSGELILFRSKNSYDCYKTYTSIIDIAGNKYSGTIYTGVENDLDGWPYWKDNSAKIKSFRVASGQTIRPVSLNGWFDGHSSLTTVDLMGIDSSAVTNFSEMFDGCAMLTELNLGNIDTANATDMSYMFYSCSSLKELDLRSFNTAKVTDMTNMFTDCTSLRTVKLGAGFTRWVSNAYLGAYYKDWEGSSTWTNGSRTLTAKELYEQYPKNASSWQGTWKGEPVLSYIAFDGKKFYTIDKGETLTLKPTYEPSATHPNVVWKADDPSIVSVDQNGIVTGLKYGETTVWVTSALDSSVKSSVNVTVIPKLTAVYNSAKGADIRWKPAENAARYYIVRKENGEWKNVAVLQPDEVEMVNGELRYYDTSIKNNYGKGYIYSIATAFLGSNMFRRDSYGIPLYRLDQPVISGVESVSPSSVKVSWKKLTCHGYEVQYSSDNGKTWTKAPQTKDTSQVITGLKENTPYIFRVRCQKTNKDRGTIWSQYSAWAKIGTASSTGTATKPHLTAIYNSANGADLRWMEISGVKEYVIMRKENKVWKEVATVSASSLKKVNGDLQYIDTAVKTKYGKGYIYSVAVKDSSGKLLYDTLGLPLYRLEPPKITSAYADTRTSLEIKYNKVNAHGYEVQYKSAHPTTEAYNYSDYPSDVKLNSIIPSNNVHYMYTYYWSARIKPDDWVSLGKTQDLMTRVSGLEYGAKYYFRVRSYKTNPDRGTTYSQWSGWAEGLPGFAKYEPDKLGDPQSFADQMNAKGVSDGVYPYCEYVAYNYTNATNYGWEEVSEPQKGDFIIYANNGQYAHTAVYIGNDLALHGNWKGTVQQSGESGIGSAYIYQQRWFYRPKYRVLSQ